MATKHKPTLIEKIAETLHIIPNLHEETEPLPRLTEPGKLTNYPPPEKWDGWVEYEAKSGFRRQKREYMIVPTQCFNCESGCGLLSYVDKQNLQVRKFEGNPYHPGSRGRNCAKGPATINQITDPDRILYPLKRVGKRGEGKWERVSWDAVLDDIAGRIRKALQEGRNNEVAYHVGRPGHEGYANRVLQAWGVDGHNSHTNICSSGARFGYAIWQGYDRPSPDHANAKFILLISAHLESGHYFNPHAQRIMEGMMNGAKLAVMDPRLSNTASMADYWMPTYPGTEAAVLLAMAKIILDENLYNEKFLRDWVNWQEYMEKVRPNEEATFANFINAMREEYRDYTPEFAAREAGIDAQMIVEVARKIGEAGERFATHNWRSAGSGNLGGWAVARCLHFLNVLTGSVGTKGGTSPSAWNKFKPKFFDTPPAQKFWNELHFPKEYPLAHYEMSQLLPHFLKEGRGEMDVYFTRVFNPVWTYPDGFTWIEALSDENMVGLHIALTPTWNETAFYADYVLPMGHAGERHDLISYETHSGMWMAFRQPVLREALRRLGKPVQFTYEANPGEVWEEDEFWIELSWRIDPDGSLGVKKHFLSPYREGEKITIDEYYQFIFENTPGLPEKAAAEGLTHLAGGAVLGLETLPDAHGLLGRPRHLDHALPEAQGGCLDLLGEQDLLLLGEGRDLGDIAEVGDQRSALRRALTVTLGVQPTQVDAAATHSSRIADRLRIGLLAELIARGDPPPGRPAPLFHGEVFPVRHLSPSHRGASRAAPPIVRIRSPAALRHRTLRRSSLRVQASLVLCSCRGAIRRGPRSLVQQGTCGPRSSPWPRSSSVGWLRLRLRQVSHRDGPPQGLLDRSITPRGQRSRRVAAGRY